MSVMVPCSKLNGTTADTQVVQTTQRVLPRSCPERVAGRTHNPERGQALVEFALVLPVFLVIVMATVDFGWALRSYITTTNSAREAARLGITGATAADIKARAVSTSAGLLTADDVTVTNAGGTPGSQLTVSVAYDYSYITPLGGLLEFMTGGALPSPLPVSTSTSMRIE